MEYIEIFKFLLFTIVSIIFGTIILLFFLLHAVQRIEDPTERTTWVLLMLFCHFFALPFYFYIKYLPFRRLGMGGLLKKKSTRESNIEKMQKQDFYEEDENSTKLKL